MEKRIRLECDDEQAFITIFKNRQEFRSVIKYRVNQFKCADITKKFNEIFSSVSYAFVPNLYIETSNIGPGLYIEHGFSTIIYAKSIGDNFHINQNVTIGAGRNGIPTIYDNVSVYANAVVIGGITLENGVKVGAGTVVTTSVSRNCTIVSAQNRIIQR